MGRTKFSNKKLAKEDAQNSINKLQSIISYLLWMGEGEMTGSADSDAMEIVEKISDNIYQASPSAKMFVATEAAQKWMGVYYVAI